MEFQDTDENPGSSKGQDLDSHGADRIGVGLCLWQWLVVMVLGVEGLAFYSAVHTGLRLSIVSLTQILAPLCQGDKEVAVVLIAAGLLRVLGGLSLSSFSVAGLSLQLQPGTQTGFKACGNCGHHL